MKLLISFMMLTIVASANQVNAQVNMPQLSPTQTIQQNFGMGKIELTYSRPSIKGRKVFGDNTELAPLGKVWRTGANAATKITFTDNVTIGGKTLDTGSYVIYTIPGKKEWEVILNKGTANWGTDGYKQSDDVAKFKVPVMKMDESVETFTIQFAELMPESCKLHLMWSNVAVSIPINTNIRERLRTQIESAMKGDKKPYQQAANFYYEFDKDYPKALQYVNEGIAANSKAYWLHFLKAKILLDMGDKAGAKMSVEKTIEAATAAKNEDMVRGAMLMREKM